jgi:hypothetical protein
MNNKYKITIKHPVLRPGLEIETEASERYLVEVVQIAMDKAREINFAEAATHNSRQVAAMMNWPVSVPAQ